MAGGENKRVSPIDSEMMWERLRRMEERMHGPVDRKQLSVYEEEVEDAEHVVEMSGELKTYQLDNIPPNFPVSPTAGVGDEHLTSGYGFRRDPITNQEGNKHGGIDFGVPSGIEILSVLDGRIQVVDNNHEIYGRYVDINHGNDIVTRYAHLSEIYVKIGDTVKKATVIGLSGGNPDDPYSGKTTGFHLHFEQRINGESVDPFSSIFYFGMYTVSNEEPY